MPEPDSPSREATTNAVSTRAALYAGAAEPMFVDDHFVPCRDPGHGDVIMGDVSLHISHRQLYEAQASEMFLLQENLETRDAHISRLMQRVTELEHYKNALKFQLNQRNSDYNKLSQALKAKQEKVSSQQVEIRKLQQHAFQNMPEGEGWTSGDDSTAKAELLKLQNRIKHWAKKYAAELLSDIRDDDGIRKINTPIARVACFAAVGAPEFLLRNLRKFSESEVLTKKLPAMLLQALLADYIYTTIIEQPFFSIAGQKDLLKLYRNLTQVDMKESHAWRSKMLQLLNRASGDGTASQYSERRASFCTHRAREFYAKTAMVLLKQLPDEGVKACFGVLDGIMKSAGELSGRLWSRKTNLSFGKLQHFSGDYFTAGSPHLDAHPIHHLEDDDDERYNGWVVGLVVHPLVSGLGNSDGSDYTTERVWMKAQVWLEEPETETQGHDDDEDLEQQDDEVDMIKLWPKPAKRTYGRGNKRKGVGRCPVL